MASQLGRICMLSFSIVYKNNCIFPCLIIINSKPFVHITENVKMSFMIIKKDSKQKKILTWKLHSQYLWWQGICEQSASRSIFF